MRKLRVVLTQKPKAKFIKELRLMGPYFENNLTETLGDSIEERLDFFNHIEPIMRKDYPNLDKYILTKVKFYENYTYPPVTTYEQFFNILLNDHKRLPPCYILEYKDDKLTAVHVPTTPGQFRKGLERYRDKLNITIPSRLLPENVATTEKSTTTKHYEPLDFSNKLESYETLSDEDLANAINQVIKSPVIYNLSRQVLEDIAYVLNEEIADDLISYIENKITYREKEFKKLNSIEHDKQFLYRTGKAKRMTLEDVKQAPLILAYRKVYLENLDRNAKLFSYTDGHLGNEILGYRQLLKHIKK